MAAPPTKEGKPPPTLRIRTETGTARILRRVLFHHNLRVCALAALTLVAAVAAWVLLYLGCSWLLVFTRSVFDPDRGSLPRGFSVVFVVTAVCALVYAWIDQRLTPNARPRDKIGIGDTIADLILVVPKMTLAVGGTLRAWQHLSETELVQAAALLHRLAEEKRVPMSGVRLQIPDSAAALRVILALQLTEIVEVYRKESEFWLRLNALRPAALRPGHGDAERA